MIRTTQKNSMELQEQRGAFDHWLPAWGVALVHLTNPANPASWMQLLAHVWCEPVPILILGLKVQALHFPKLSPFRHRPLSYIPITLTPGDTSLI